MTILRVVALFVIFAFAGCVIAAGFMTGPASANKMNGKPGGGPNVAHYGPLKGGAPYGQPPARMKKPAGQ